MKKLILTLGIILSVAAASAANWQTYNLLGGGISAVWVTNALATGTGGGITNLLSRGLQTTNVNGVVITNNGVFVVTTNTVASDQNLLADYWPMPTRADGSPPYTAVSNFITGIYFPGDFNLNIKATGQSAANTAVTLTIVPVTGKGADLELEEAEAWNVAFVPTTTTQLIVNTNIPLYRWPGAAGLRVKRIVNGDADASSAVIIQELSINGPRP